MQNEKLKIAIKNSKLDIKIIKLVESLPNDRVCKIIADQLLKSATSIGANIIEAQAASSKRDFTNFLNYSLKSANETKFWLGLLRDSGKKDRGIINPLLDEAKQLSSILASSILKLKRKKF